MKILFTKSLDEEFVVKHLPQGLQAEFHEVISITPRRARPFDLKNYSLIFTSVNAVEAFFGNGFRPHEDFTERNFNKIYAVGLKTKKALREHGFGTYKVARNARELSEFIIDNSSSERFIHFCGNLALDVLNRTLPLQNISYRKLVIYDTALLYPKLPQDFTAVCFFSPSGVRSFAEHNTLLGKTIFSIGATTTDEILRFTSANLFTSEENNLNDMLDLINAWHRTGEAKAK